LRRNRNLIESNQKYGKRYRDKRDKRDKRKNIREIDGQEIK